MRGQVLCKSCNEGKNMQENSKPPIGLRPASIWKAETYRLRGVEIAQAVQRYAEAGASIPDEWLRELAVINKFTQQA
jgi:hypothetical protein